MLICSPKWWVNHFGSIKVSYLFSIVSPWLEISLTSIQPLDCNSVKDKRNARVLPVRVGFHATFSNLSKSNALQIPHVQEPSLLTPFQFSKRNPNNVNVMKWHFMKFYLAPGQWAFNLHKMDMHSPVSYIKSENPRSFEIGMTSSPFFRSCPITRLLFLANAKPSKVNGEHYAQTFLASTLFC